MLLSGIIVYKLFSIKKQMEISQWDTNWKKQIQTWLSSLQIEKVLANCLNWNTCYVEAATMNSNMQEWFNTLRNFDVIEIWPWWNPIIKFFPCKSYQWVQPFECSVNNPECKWYVIEDWLTFLRKQKDKSAWIVSIWVIDEDVLNCMGTKEWKQYIQEICNEIKRVAYPFAIIIWANVDQYMWKANIWSDTGFNFVSGWIYFSNAISFDEFVERQNNFHAHFHPAYNEKAVTLRYRERLAFQRFSEYHPKLCNAVLEEMEIVNKYRNQKETIPEDSPYNIMKDNNCKYRWDIFSNPKLPIVKLMYQAYCFMRIYVEWESLWIRWNYEDVLFW